MIPQRLRLRPRIEFLEQRLPFNAAPVFQDQTLHIDENSPAGSSAGVVAVDHDGEVRFEVTGGSGQSAFVMDAATGEITVRATATLDHETNFLFQLDVTARDVDDPGLSADAVVTVRIDNVNEAPIIENSIGTELALGSLQYELTIPDDVFRDPDLSDTFVQVLTLSDGSPLPSWLDFDPDSMVLSGFPPNVPGATNLALTATDQSGLSTVELFALQIIENPHPWQNFVDPLDVNADGKVDPRDIALVASNLHVKGIHELDRVGPASPPVYLDVHANDFLTPQDILQLVAHFLQSSWQAEAEGSREVRAECDAPLEDLLAESDQVLNSHDFIFGMEDDEDEEESRSWL